MGQFIERTQAEKALHARERELGLGRAIQQGRQRFSQDRQIDDRTAVVLKVTQA